MALAVSGGSDSMALMRLVHRWAAARERPPRLTVLTVDHGLRAGSTAEAERVAQWCGELALAHHVLPWIGPKPRTGIQSKARRARYDLMTAWCSEHGASVVATAHTMDDQAETVLMRMARTASIDSLASIHRVTDWNGIAVHRPLLGERRADLRAFLQVLGQGWIDDPSNEDERFERVRVRKAMAALGEAGVTVPGLADLARQALEISHALWGATEDWVDAHAEPHDMGYVRLSATAFADHTGGLETRILGRLICRFGAGKMPEPAELERLSAWLVIGASGRRTLGGAMIARRERDIIIGREPGRIDPVPVTVPGSGQVRWDQRFDIWAEPGSVILPAGLAGPARRCKDIPAFVQASLPAVVTPGGETHMPHLEERDGMKALFVASNSV